MKEKFFSNDRLSSPTMIILVVNPTVIELFVLKAWQKPFQNSTNLTSKIRTTFHFYFLLEKRVKSYITLSARESTGQYFVLHILLSSRTWNDVPLACNVLPSRIRSNVDQIRDQEQKRGHDRSWLKC